MLDKNLDTVVKIFNQKNILLDWSREFTRYYKRQKTH